MNSKTPSEARIRHRVFASSWYVRSSGRAQTPSFFPVASPSERVNAHPGNVAPFRKTRGGSSAASMLSSPKSSLRGVSPRIMPSVANITGSVASFFMRSRSSFRKHVWSCDTSSTSQRGPAPSSEARRFPRAGDDGADDASFRGSTPSSARLSPTFPMCSISPMT
jgi:hypothetical protein